MNKILIVEDHPIMTQNYITSCNEVKNHLNIKFKYETTSSCKQAYEVILKSIENNEEFILAIVDISIPSFLEKGIMSGEEIASYISQNMPNTKIVICTSLEDNFRLSNVISTIKPHSILIKSEIEGQDIVNTIKDVLSNKKSYSPKISKIIDNLTDSSIDYLDKIDRNIINEIAMASRLVDMMESLNISRANIEKRKMRIKVIFDVKNDRELLIEAKRRGFI